MQSAILAILLIFAVGIIVGHPDSDEIGYHSEESGHRTTRVTSCANNRDMKDQFIKAFLRKHCPNAEGNYDLCRQCVAVACLQFMARPTQSKPYQKCIDAHNRCCTRPGVSTDNVASGAQCYATGWISEVGWGQVSVIRTLLGGQSADAPDSFTGNKKRHDDD